MQDTCWWRLISRFLESKDLFSLEWQQRWESHNPRSEESCSPLKIVSGYKLLHGPLPTNISENPITPQYSVQCTFCRRCKPKSKPRAPPGKFIQAKKRDLIGPASNTRPLSLRRSEEFGERIQFNRCLILATGHISSNVPRYRSSKAENRCKNLQFLTTGTLLKNSATTKETNCEPQITT